MSTTARRVPLGMRVVSAPLVWLERSRGWRRRLLVLAYLLVTLIFGMFAYRWAAIAKLPDVGDPFDVRAFEASIRVPEGRNAVPLYRQADQALDGLTLNSNLPATGATTVQWSKVDAKTKAWSAAARPAMETWRQATERPEAVWIAPETATFTASRSSYVNDRRFITLAQLEASRLQEAGDFAGAWRWYRAALRFSRHLAANTIMDKRAMGTSFLQYRTDQISGWAVDPEVPPAVLRQAIRDLDAIDAMTPPNSQTLKLHYITLMNSLDDLDELTREMVLTYPFDEWRRWYQGYWFLKNEPRRTRRIVKLIFANRLAWCDRPSQRPPQVGNDARDPIWILYEPDPKAPPAARALPPGEIYGWIESSMIAPQVIPMFRYFEPIADADHSRIGVLSIKAAENLYRQEKGKEAQSPGALVEAGYLKSLPADYQVVGGEAEE